MGYLPGPLPRNAEGRREGEDKSEPTYLEELDPDAGEHELEQRGDNHNVPDGADGDEHTLDHVLQREARRAGAVVSGEACTPGFLWPSMGSPFATVGSSDS